MTSKSIAVVMLHGDCNMRCSFCITDNHIETMSRANYDKTLDRLQDDGYNNIVIGGGEPFCWPEGIVYAASTAKKRGFYVQVGTNGVQMTSDDVAQPCIDRYVLPLDAADPALHNEMRRMTTFLNNHHALIEKRLEQCRGQNRSVTVSTVVSRANLGEVIAIGDHLADYVADGGRLHAWHLYCFIPRGRGGSLNAESLGISREAFDAAVNEARSQHYPYVIYKRPDMRHSAEVDFFWREGGKLCVGSEVWGADAQDPKRVSINMPR